MIVVQLTTAGHTGLGYSYAHEAAATVAENLIKKEVLSKDVHSIPEIHLAMDRAVRDIRAIPAWFPAPLRPLIIVSRDLKARILGLPLLRLLGAARREIPAYGSGGFTSYSDRQLIDQLAGWAEEGFSCVKMKIGREPERDLHRITEVQKALNGKTELRGCQRRISSETT